MNQRSMPVLESFTRTWPDLETAHERSMSAAATLLRCRGELLSLLTRVSTYSAARDELLRSVATLSGAPAELARNCPPQLSRLTVVLPSRDILYAYVLFALVPALYCDEVVVRPSPDAVGTTSALHHVLVRRLGPEFGARVQLTEATGRSLVPVCADSDAVVLHEPPGTGGQEGGAAGEPAAAFGDRPLVLFRGAGPNPLVVGPRTEPAAAGRAVLRARLHNSGQDSRCPDVVFVHRLRLDAVVERLRAELSVLTVGARSWPESVLTALSDPGVVEGAARFLARHREHLVAGGGADPDRMTVEPSLLVLPEGTGFHPPELLAPVFCVVPYEDPEALREWARDPGELRRGMYVSVLGEPRLTGETLGTAVLVRHTTALDTDGGNHPWGGYGVRASSVRREGQLIGRPLLLSHEAGLGGSPLTGPLR